MAGKQVGLQVGDAALRLRHHPLHENPGGPVAASHHGLLLDIGRGGDDAGKVRELRPTAGANPRCAPRDR